MKTYFRLLSFAKPIEKFAIPYIIFTLLSIVFNTLNLALLVPLLQTLFSNDKACGPVAAPLAKPSLTDLSATFDYYTHYFISNYGAWSTLQFVCGVLVVSVVLSNLFRYGSQRIMENLRLHTLLNLRKSVFNNVMDLHMGYFSNERKGDIISKISSDVQVVQFSVTGTLQVVFKEPAQLIFYVFTLFAISTKLTIYSLLVIPVSAFIISRIVKRLKSQAIAARGDLW
nr:ABC transporter transmembrane domain-containing protein [Mucilaginibacter humi]